jgi:hypothetical protein
MNKRQAFKAINWSAVIAVLAVCFSAMLPLGVSKARAEKAPANETPELKTLDTTERGDASFQKSGDRYTIVSSGIFSSGGPEGYGAIYAPDIFKSRMTVEVTLESQEYTREWAKTGLKIANDMTDTGGSTGDLILYATAGHGFKMGWDGNSDGYVGNIVSGKDETSFPVTLKLERAGPFVTGYYSTDGGQSFTEVGIARLPEADDAMDVGMVQASSNNKRGKAVFSGFKMRNAAAIDRVTEPDPLPENAEALDRVIFGNKPSEQRHDFAPESSWLDWGRNGTIVRNIQRVIPEVDVPHEWIIGSMSFKMKVDPDERNYLTLKVQQERGALGRDPLTIFHGDEQIGYLNGREGYSTPGSFFTDNENVTTGDWVYVTSVLPKSVTEGKETVRLRVATYNPHAGPMKGYIGTEWPIYRAYTHTDALFEFPSDEDPFNRSLGTPGVDGKGGDIDKAMATVKSNVEASVKHGQQKEKVGELVAEHLARASKRDWIETVDEDRIYELVRDTIDRQLRGWEKQDRKMIHQGCWRCNGNLARAFTIMADEFKERGALAEPIPGSPNDDPRRKVYTDFFVDAYQFRQNDRNVITNQVQIVTNALIAMADALEILNPERAPLDMKVQGWIDQLIGVEPLTKLPGERGGAGAHWRSPAYFQWSDGGYTIRSGGGFYKTGEAYGAIYTPDAFKSGMTVGVTLERQENTDAWAKTGLKLANDMTDAGGSPGDLILVATPEHGYIMAMDKNRDGSVETVGREKRETTYPVSFMLKRDGAQVTGYYSTDGGDSFKKIGTAKLPQPNVAMDVGMVQTGNKPNNPGKAVFSDFAILNDGEVFKPNTNAQPLASAEKIEASANGNRQLKVVDTTNPGGLMYTLSEAGLNREPRYASGHGEIPNIMLSKLAEDTEMDAVDERLLEHIEAMGWFRWRGSINGRRQVIQNGFLSARHTSWPGDTGLWLPFTRAPAVLGAVEEPNEMVKRWAEYMVEVGADFTLYPKVNKRLTRLNNMMPMYDGLKRLKQLEPSTYKLPWERERAVWGDPDQGMVSITDGDVRIQACLGMNHGTHISDIAKFGYLGPNGHRVGTVNLRRKEFPLDRMIERPNDFVTFRRGIDYSTGDSHDTPFYMPWRGERRPINLYGHGEEVPLASKPNGESWPLANKYPENATRADYNVGFTYYYREARIGPYLIGINSTGAPKRAAGPGKTYQMDVPTDSAINLRTGKRVKSDNVTVGPRETVVLKLEKQ